ncbi:MAG: hydroxylamine reductase [Candidatus Omnitrophota bacterium]
MFCRQCEQTFRCQGCDKMGVCGKTPEVATLQDLLIHALKGLAVCGLAARETGIQDAGADALLMKGIFITVTNVNFDPAAIASHINLVYQAREKLKTACLKACRDQGKSGGTGAFPEITRWVPAKNREGLLEQGRAVGLRSDPGLNDDIRSLREILLYGIKGMASYAEHAFRLGATSAPVTDFLYKGLAALTDASLNADALLGLILQCGKANLTCMEMLDKAHTDHYGHPEPTKVAIGCQPGPAIIVSGHDLLDLENLLRQTQGKGVNIYTHGEMLPAHGYPRLKKYPHLVGHFGTAWQNQQDEFNNIPAVILMTTNCIQEPRPSYSDRIYTTNVVGWPGVTHIPEQDGQKDFSPLIQNALNLKGFKDHRLEKEIVVGFAHHAVLGIADKILDAVQGGKIRRFFLIGGCDGAKPGRNYFSQFAEAVPPDCLILTLACGKHRINRHDYGDVDGIPRLLDCGQCNDAYSAVVIAQALAKALNCGVNDLPLSLIISWYEQKAVAILLTLLFLGIKNIHLGPSLPAFISPNVLNILVEKFQIKPTGNALEDLNAILVPPAT